MVGVVGVGQAEREAAVMTGKLCHVDVVLTLRPEGWITAVLGRVQTGQGTEALGVIVKIPNGLNILDVMSLDER